MNWNTATMMLGMLLPPVAAQAPAQLPMSPDRAVELLQQHAFFVSHNEEHDELFNTISERFLNQVRNQQTAVAQGYPWLAELLHLAELNESPFLLQPRFLQAFLALGGDVNAKDTYGCSAVDYALRLSPRRFLKILTEAGATVEVAQSDADGMTPLMYAAREGDAEACARLIGQGAYVNAFSEQGECVLALALQSGDADCIDTLLAAGASTSAEIEDDTGCSLLHHAAAAAPVRYVDMLLRGGAQIDMADLDAQTPLMIAAAEGRADVVRCLLDAGASPSLRNAAGEDALSLAVEAGDAACVEMLLTALREANKRAATPGRLGDLLELMLPWDADSCAVARVLLEHGAALEVERVGWNYLGMAIKYGDLELMHLLEKAGVEYDAHTPDDNGVTYLMYAVSSGHMPLVEHLLKDGADCAARDNDGDSVMMYAFMCENSAPVHRLLLAGARLNPTERMEPMGWTQLMLAAAQGDEVLVRFLLEAGAGLNVRSETGDTALTMALSHGHAGIVRLLRAAGADFNPSDRRDGGSTLLMHAAAGGLAEVVEELLVAGVDVDSMRHFPASCETPLMGSTALMLAAEKGHEAVVRRLLAAGADASLRDIHGNTAADRAQESGFSVLADMLRQAEKNAR